MAYPPEGRPSSYLTDLDLTHQYLTSTYATLWEGADAQVVWRDAVFRTSLRFPALLDGILATAAMHRIATSVIDAPARRDLSAVALRKQTTALQGLRTLLPSMDAHNCEATFVLAILVSFWAFASRTLPEELDILSDTFDLQPFTHPSSTPSTTPTPSTSPPLSASSSITTRFINLLYKLRPLVTIAMQAGPLVLNRGLSGLIRVRDDERPLNALPPETERALDDLEAVVMRHRDPNDDGDLKNHPMEELRRCFRELATDGPVTEHIVGWPVGLSEKHFDALRRREPGALAMVGYWAVCFHVLDGRWWARRWAGDLVAEIARSVGGEWARILEWPLRKTGKV